MAGLVAPPSPAAGILSGIAFDKAPNNVSKARKPVIPRAFAAAGKCGFTILPGGAITLIGLI